MDGLYLFLIVLFAGLMLGFIALCARLAPPALKPPAAKYVNSPSGERA